MLRIRQMLRLTFFFASLLGCTGVAIAQKCPDNDATLPTTPVAYPLASNQYSVQYQIDGGGWTPAMVFISYYGETNASPLRNGNGVPYVTGTTSMSFVSIPARANAVVQLRVTKLATGPFQFSDHVTVRPTPLFADVDLEHDGTVEISTRTAGNFNGEQFILMWNHGTDGGGVEGLAFYLNPPYTRPKGTNVKVVKAWSDLQGFANDPNLLIYNTIDFESSSSAPLPVPIQLGGDGGLAYKVPANILNVFFGPSAWVRGKLQFNKITATTHIYGPGVLDGSQFNYLNRDCVNAAGNPTEDGLYSLSSLDQSGNLTNFDVDGIIISDQNHAANDPFFSSTINNVKTLGWNSNNAALRLQDSTTASNIFIRSSDDSMMIWGSPVTVTNATVWQGYNGGVISLGWSDNSVGDHNMVDGLWVVKTDWVTPTVQSWDALSQPGPPKPVNGQNDGIIASLMIPSTSYGKNSPPVFRNIYVEDPPQVLFSIKIVPPVNCTIPTCMATFLTTNSSLVQLKIENLFSPQSVIENSIGFQIIPKGFIANATDTVSFFPKDFTLTGKMNIELTNVWIKLPFGLALPLTNAFDAEWLGKITTNGAGVNVKYNLGPPLFW